MNYALMHINAATRAASEVEAGYSDEFLIAELSSFTQIKTPSGNGPTGRKTVTLSHTFAQNDGFYELRGKIGTAMVDGESVGEAGGGVIRYKPKITVVGDSAEICDYIENLLSREVMLLALPKDCYYGTSSGATQYGGKCSPCIVTKVSFKSGAKNSGGLKEYEIEFETFEKLFYLGTVTKAPY